MDRQDEKAEIELKLAVPSDALSKLARDPRLKALVGGGGTRRHLRTTYFDTPDRRLLSAELALRVRREGRRRIQTLKTSAHPTLGLLARGEWEREIVGERPVLDDAWLAEIGDKEARKLLAKSKVRARLTPMFSTDFRRHSWRIRRAGSVIELAIDKGTIEGPEGLSPISEVELELKSGDPGELYGLAREIVGIVPAVVESRSKAERGYALSVPARGSVRASAVGIDKDATVEVSFREVGRTCLAHARANESLVRTKPSIEGVHQLRVALRRMRSALAAFRDVLPETERRAKADDLRWIASSCGAARDWDVFRNQLLKPLTRHLEDEPALARVTRAAEAARRKAYRDVQTMLGTSRLTHALLDVEAWWEKGGWAEGMGEWRNAPVREFAGLVLRRLHRNVARLGRNVAELPEAELHELRIRCKKLRYAAEFFRGAFARKTAAGYLAALAEVQEHLGALNDAVVAKSLLAELGRDSPGLPPELLARAEGIVTGWIAARVRNDLEQLPGLWRRFAEQRPFWK
ncbi:MAG: CHAD domain-containing protein [Rhodospirillales bacterium]|nr:CHAD domain-containing protein [Rhodospirillales bacterium]